MDPTLISQAISNMEIGKITIEEIRNKLSLSKLVDSKTQEIINASTEKGEKYVYNPTEYFVTFTYDKRYGAEFGKKLLYNILKSYDTYFIEKYYKKIEIDNFLNNQDVAQADYMDVCNLINKNISSILTDIGYLEENDKDFRSSRTGMKFSDLKNLYAGIQQNEYNKYYANVREGHLTKNLEKFITTYQDKVEATNLLMNISSNESLLSKETLQQFYNQYKSALNYDTASKNSQVENNNENDNTRRIEVDQYALII
jgi:hypothetical protein